MTSDDSADHQPAVCSGRTALAPRASRSALAALSLIVGGLCLTTVGCTSSTRPGDVSRVQTFSDAPRAGNVYLLRGWIGIFSEGIDQLGTKLNAAGVRATVYQEDQWRRLADQIERRYAGKSDYEPLVLIGHSYGADSVVRIAQVLREKGVEVDLLITLDPVTPPRVPANVLSTYNLYQSNGLMDAFPWLRGIPLVASDDNRNTVVNADIRTDRIDLLTSNLDHFNIEKQPLVHDDVVRQVLAACPPRDAWASARTRLAQYRVTRASTRTRATADFTASSTTRPTDLKPRPLP